MRKFILISGFLLALLPAFALADIYRWTDTEGVLHITDDLDKIPHEYRNKIITTETEAAENGVKVDASKRDRAGDKPKDPETEFYGDHPLNWWRLTFNRLHSEIDAASKELEQKEQFIDMFTRGRRLGQRNKPEDIETFKKYKVEMPLVKKRLKELEGKLEDLKRSARKNGVPKDARR